MNEKSETAVTCAVLEQAFRDWWTGNARFADIVDQFWMSQINHRAVLTKCDRTLNLELLGRLGPGRRPEYLRELMELATTYHGERDKALKMILDLPREFLREHLQEATDRVLSDPDKDDLAYNDLLEIYEDIQADELIPRLLERMAQDPTMQATLDAILDSERYSHLRKEYGR